MTVSTPSFAIDTEIALQRQSVLEGMLAVCVPPSSVGAFMPHQPGVESKRVSNLIFCKMRELSSRPILLSVFLRMFPLCLLLHLRLVLFVRLAAADCPTVRSEVLTATTEPVVELDLHGHHPPGERAGDRP